MNPLTIIQAHAAEVRALGARRIGVFGSFARGDAGADSDLDVFVEFAPGKRTYDNFFALHELLEQLAGRRIDLVTDQALTETKARLILPTAPSSACSAATCWRWASSSTATTTSSCCWPPTPSAPTSFWTGLWRFTCGT